MRARRRLVSDEERIDVVCFRVVERRMSSLVDRRELRVGAVSTVLLSGVVVVRLVVQG